MENMQTTLDKFDELGKVKRRLVKGKTMFIINRPDGKNSFAVYGSHDETELVLNTGVHLSRNDADAHLTKITVLSPDQIVRRFNTAAIHMMHVLSDDFE